MPKKKPRPKDEKPQKQRFIDTAKEVGADQTGEVFEEAVKKILPDVGLEQHQKHLDRE